MFGTMVSGVGVAVGEAVAAVAGECRDGWSGPARSARLVELLTARERLDAEVLRCAGEWDAAGAWREGGAVTAASWLVDRAPMTRADAVTLVRSARLAWSHEPTGKAVAAGDITAPHVEPSRHETDTHGTNAYQTFTRGSR